MEKENSSKNNQIPSGTTPRSNPKKCISKKDLTNLDEFIQNCLDKFKFIDPKEEFYEATGDEKDLIISHKSTIPDLVIWNKVFNKNECFIESNNKKMNSFPRFQFYLRIKSNKPEKDKKKEKKNKKNQKNKKKEKKNKKKNINNNNNAINAINANNINNMNESLTLSTETNFSGKARYNNVLSDLLDLSKRDYFKSPPNNINNFCFANNNNEYIQSNNNATNNNNINNDNKSNNDTINKVEEKKIISDLSDIDIKKIVEYNPRHKNNLFRKYANPQKENNDINNNNNISNINNNLLSLSNDFIENNINNNLNNNNNNFIQHYNLNNNSNNNINRIPPINDIISYYRDKKGWMIFDNYNNTNIFKMNFTSDELYTFLGKITNLKGYYVCENEFNVRYSGEIMYNILTKFYEINNNSQIELMLQRMKLNDLNNNYNNIINNSINNNNIRNNNFNINYNIIQENNIIPEFIKTNTNESTNNNSKIINNDNFSNMNMNFFSPNFSNNNTNVANDIFNNNNFNNNEAELLLFGEHFFNKSRLPAFTAQNQNQSESQKDEQKSNDNNDNNNEDKNDNEEFNNINNLILSNTIINNLNSNAKSNLDIYEDINNNDSSQFDSNNDYLYDNNYFSIFKKNTK